MDKDEFRRAMRQVAGAVTVVTACTPDGEWRGVTATAVCSLTADPPSVIACIKTPAIESIGYDGESTIRSYSSFSAAGRDCRFRVSTVDDRAGLQGLRRFNRHRIIGIYFNYLLWSAVLGRAGAG